MLERFALSMMGTRANPRELVARTDGLADCGERRSRASQGSEVVEAQDAVAKIAPRIH